MAALLDEGVPHMTPQQGRAVYDHIRSEGVRDVLEIGTAHAVSASYMAAAVEENGGGSVTTIDHANATKARDPSPQAILDGCGVGHLVNRVLVTDSSYTWWLKNQVASQSDSAGNCTPLYDFCYLDGAHNFTIDGLAAYLVEKLLRPGAWLLLDDLDWRYRSGNAGPGQSADDLHLSEDERRGLPMQDVFDVIVRQHPSFGEFRVEDEHWAWAHKVPAAVRRYEVVETVPVRARAMHYARSARRRLAR